MRCYTLLLSLVVLALIINSSTAEESLCADAVSALIPCGSFLVGDGEPKPSDQCCTSAQKLNRQAENPASRKALCECLKESGPSFGVKPERAKELPTLCKLKLSIPIDPKVNCTNV